ncbi:hypothetical protein PRUPE_1G176500 [Prunus persica]|uniref:Reverse transcriptase domain-containing protein n=1 Tax=Prunus persica TaxID=3760 RepID=A0A251QZ21_PRUPE|nr:hypothetical protein PRUPE_1G176500 [Prunus persica]
MQVFEKLKWVRKGLVDWKRHKWRSSKVYIDNLREKLCAAFRGLVFLGNKIKRLEKDLKTELQKEEQYWKLKSRVEWLQEGDKNTKFFHSKTVSRRRINRLHGLEDQGGIWYGEAYDIKRIVKSYFQDLFMSANPVERQITDNILVVHEILHTLKTAQGSDQQYMAMKLDMAKAYDRVKWAFLDAMMEKLRFESRFRGWIMECVTIVSCKDGLGKYLGLKDDFGASKQQIFESVCQKISVRLHGWAEQFLFAIGKEILFKIVAMAMPNHAMSCFKLSVSLCKEIEGEIARFWWKNGADRKPIHWVGWKKLSRLKKDGGLGFRELTCFNLAMLAKIGWRILCQPQSVKLEILLRRIILSCY